MQYQYVDVANAHESLYKSAMHLVVVTLCSCSAFLIKKAKLPDYHDLEKQNNSCMPRTFIISVKSTHAMHNKKFNACSKELNKSLLIFGYKQSVICGR